MSDGPVILRDLHASILMRVYVLGGTAVALDRIIEELRSSRSANEVCAAVGDMENGLLSVDGTTDPRITLERNGRRYARMYLDLIALTEPTLFAANTRASRFLDHFAQHKQGMGQDPSQWQLFKQQLKWLFRRNWEPA